MVVKLNYTIKYIGNIKNDFILDSLTKVEGHYKTIHGKKIWTATHYRQALKHGEGLMRILWFAKKNVEKAIKELPDGPARINLELKKKNLEEYIKNIDAEREIIRRLKKKYGKIKADFSNIESIKNGFLALMDDFVDDFRGPKYFCELQMCQHPHYYESQTGRKHILRLARMGISPRSVDANGQPIGEQPIPGDPIEVVGPELEIPDLEPDDLEIELDPVEELLGVDEDEEELQAQLAEEESEYQAEFGVSESELLQKKIEIEDLFREYEHQMDLNLYGNALVALNQSMAIIDSLGDRPTYNSFMVRLDEMKNELNIRVELQIERTFREEGEREASELRVDVQSKFRMYREHINRYLEEDPPDISAARTAMNLAKRKVETLPEGVHRRGMLVALIRLKNKIDRVESERNRRGFTEPERQTRAQATERRRTPESYTGDPQYNPRPTPPEGMIITRRGYWRSNPSGGQSWIKPKFGNQEEYDRVLAERARRAAEASAAARRYLRTHLYETDDNNQLIYDSNGNKIPRKKIRWRIKPSRNLLTLKKSDLRSGDSIYINVLHPTLKGYDGRPLEVGGASLSVRTDARNQPYLYLGSLEIDPPKWQGRGAVKHLLAPLVGFVDKNNIVIRGGASPMNRDVRWAPAHLTPEEKQKWRRNAFKDLVAMYKSMGGRKYRGAGRGGLERIPHPERFGSTETPATVSSSYYDFIGDIDDLDDIIEIDIHNPENIMVMEDRVFYYDEVEEQSYELHFNQPEAKKLDFDMIYRGNIYNHPLTEDIIDITKFKNMKHDFQTTDFTVYHGPITREGPFDYYKNGKKITLIKDYGNLKERFGEIDYLPLKAVVGNGSHHAKVHGFTTNFELEDKPAKGHKYRQVYGDIVLMNDIYNHPDSIDLKKYHVSIGFEDDIEGNKQIIKNLDHLAMSDTEIGRCSTAGGDECTVKKVHDKSKSKS